MPLRCCFSCNTLLQGKSALNMNAHADIIQLLEKTILHVVVYNRSDRFATSYLGSNGCSKSQQHQDPRPLQHHPRLRRR